MSLIKHKLLKIANSEDEIELTEKPFVSKILSSNNVYYFRGLYMKVWADNPFVYKTQQVNKNWTFTYGRGVTQLSDGQDRFDVINMEWDGRTDEDGYRFFEFPSVYVDGQEGVGMWVKKKNGTDKILMKIADESGETLTQEWSSYTVDESMSNDEYTYYYVFTINEPNKGYVDVIDTIGPCEGKKVYLHDEYFMLDGDSAPSAVTKLEFCKDIREIPVASFVRFYKLSEVVLPAKLTQLGANTFSYCIGLSAMTIPSNVTFIDSDAFYYCNNLTDIYFDNSLTMLPAGAPWGASNAIVRCRDGYFEGEIKYLYNRSGSEDNQYYRRCWGLDIVDAPNKGTLYAFVKQSEYDAYHNDYLTSINQGGLWSGNTEGALSHVSEICYVNEISGKTGSVMVAVPNVSGGTPVLNIPDGSIYVPVSIEDGVLTCPFGTFQHYDFLDYTDNSGGGSVQLYGFCNRIGYTKYPNESDSVFHERVKIGIERDLEGGGYDDEDVSDIPFKLYLFNRQDDYTGYDFTYSATTVWRNSDIASTLNKPSVNLPTYNILSSTTFVPGNVIIRDEGGWVPDTFKRFTPMDIVVGDKTYYAFLSSDFVDQYYQAGYGDTFDGRCISGLSFDMDSVAVNYGFSGSEVKDLYDRLYYTDSLNPNVAYYDSGDLVFSPDLQNVGFRIGTAMGYEDITISGGSVVSALCFMDDAENNIGPRFPSGDIVIDDITYYCFKSGYYSWYLTDISEGRKFRFYTNSPSEMGDYFMPINNNSMQFLSEYTGIANITTNSGNTISYAMDNEAQNIHEAEDFHYFEPYNVIIGGTTFYAYIPHEMYATANRILSNSESGITSGLDTRLYTAMCTENANSQMILNGKIQTFYMTDISQGNKGSAYTALLDVYQSNPNSYVGQVRLRDHYYADLAQYGGSVTCRITHNPDLDTTILIEKAITDGATIQMPFTIANGNINLSGITLYPHPEFDTVVSGTTYYAFVDKNVSCEHSDDVEAVKILIGQLSNNSSVLPTGENSCKLLFTTAHGDGSYSGSTIYGGGVNVVVDMETGDSSIETYVSLNNGSGGSGGSGDPGVPDEYVWEVPFAVSGGTVTVDGDMNLYHCPAFDIVSGGTTYYALIDLNITPDEGMSDVEFAGELLGGQYGQSDFQSSENSCDLFFIDTMVDGYYSDRALYQGGMSRMTDAETGDAYIQIVAHVPSPTAQWEI